MSRRTSLNQIFDIINDGEKLDSEVVWSVGVDQVASISVLGDGSSLVGTNQNLSSPTLMVVEEITQVDYDALPVKSSTTLYVIPV